MDKTLELRGPAKGPVGFSQNHQQSSPLCEFESALWENQARITRAVSIQVWLTFVNGLLSFKIPERIVADPPHPLMNP